MSGNVLQEKASASSNVRPVHTYRFPDSLAKQGIRSVGLVEITSHEEIQATKRAGHDQYRLGYELAKQSLVEYNDERVSLADGGVESAFDRMGPKARSLVLQAYVELHGPGEDDTQGFLGSHETKVG